MTGIIRTLKRNSRLLLTAAVIAGSAMGAKAVTDNEMNQAEAIAAKYYIRYVNNMSGYLDEITPTSMADLESKLTNDKDKESLKQFKSASISKDYATWDKDKLVEYWSVTFFSDNASRLDAKGANNGQAKMKIKKGVAAIQVAAPAPPEPAAAPEPEAEPEPEQAAEPISAAPYDPLSGLEVEAEGDDLQNEIDALKDSLAAEETPHEESKSSGTWVYIMILSILVVVVIALVAYASRTMKGSKKTDSPSDLHPTDRSNVGYTRTSVEETRMREKYAESLAAKTEEIMQLSRQLTDMEMLAAQLKEENRMLRLELEGSRGRSMEHPQAVSTAGVAPMPDQPASTGMHEVYLGRVNARGIFVRADRQPVEGQSIYRLNTTNGVSGTFTLLSNPVLDRQLLGDPEKWLSGGCFAADLFDTAGKHTVVTETPGAAIFKDGAWRVDRKSRIRYE